jgi:hypothetical protein
MDGAIEIRYAGVVIGRGALQPAGAGAFVAFADPLPVGSECELDLPSGRQRVRVERVVERGADGEPGMRVRYLGADAETAGVPQEVEPETSSRPVGEPSQPVEAPSVTGRHTIAYGVSAADLAVPHNPDANGKPVAGGNANQPRSGKKKRR